MTGKVLAVSGRPRKDSNEQPPFSYTGKFGVGAISDVTFMRIAECLWRESKDAYG